MRVRLWALSLGAAAIAAADLAELTAASIDGAITDAKTAFVVHL